jgi:hypothetical protein
MCKVLNVRQVGRRAAPDRVYVGRPSKWGNPFVIGRDGTRSEGDREIPRMDRAAAGAHGGAARAARQAPRLLMRAGAVSRGGADQTPQSVKFPPGAAARAAPALIDRSVLA